VRLTVERRDGVQHQTTVIVERDPSMRVVPAEAAGTLDPAARAERETWLATRVR
jgi:hypothetical protein